MITVHPARMQSTQRVQTQSNKTPDMQVKPFGPPIAGWVTNRPLVGQLEQSAFILENFWPTATGIEPRGGTHLRVTVAAAVTALFQYRAGSTPEYFAATATSIYPFTDATADNTALTASVTGQTSGDYAMLETRTAGGSFLTLVNGVDYLQMYDGTSWQQVTGVSSPHAITGVDTALLSHIWAYGNRQFFIESGTMNAWYLGINSVSGAATSLPLSGVFNNGGSLCFGATLSSDSGAGMDDRCVFVTDRGEIAIYTGNPADSTWTLNGVYDIGEPLGKRGHMSVGGDLIIATKAGLIPVSAAIRKDPAQLKLDALSRPIDPDWRQEVVLAGNVEGWRLEKWAARNMAVVSPPPSTTQGYCFAINLETNAWTKFTGWNIEDIAVLGENLHYGDADGNIYKCETGGTDNDNAFVCQACLNFDHLGAIGAYKTAHEVRGTWKRDQPINPKHSVATDYVSSFPAAPSAADLLTTGGAEWDVATWDVDEWAVGETVYQVEQKWNVVSGHGKVLAPQIQITCSASYKLACELIALDLTYSTGAVVE